MQKMFKSVVATLMLFVLLLGMVCVPRGVQATVSGTVPQSDDMVTVVVGSDFQYSNSNHGIAGGHVSNMLATIKKSGYGSIDGFFFAGDYSQAFTEAATQAGLSHLQGVVSEAYPQLSDDRKMWLQGNHDPDALVDAGVLSASGANDTSDYGVFLINEKDYMWYNDDEETVKSTATALKNYLNEKCQQQYGKPIFIVSHLQLHYSMRTYSNGDGKYANYLFDVINEAAGKGLNIVFLFGHNHSNGWDDYLGGSAVFLQKGDSILIAQSSTTQFREETLNFTYLNAGYVGYYTEVNSGAETDLSMTVFSFSDEEMVVTRFTESGIHDLKATGVTNAYKNETAYPSNTEVYTSSQIIKLNKMNQAYGVTQAYLDRVDSAAELKEGVPYVISDYKDSWLHYVLTSQPAKKVSGSKTHQGYLLDGTASSDTTDLWYIRNGKLVYGSADSNQYLRITCDSSRQGQVTLGSYNASTAAYVVHYNSDDFAIRGSTGYYLNRHGGTSKDFVATAYSSAGGSYWHLDRLMPEQDVTMTATPDVWDLFVGGKAFIDCMVTVDGIEADDAALSWSSSDSSVVTVSEGSVSAVRPGEAIISVTLSTVDGKEMKEPITVDIPLTVYSVGGTVCAEQDAAVCGVGSLSSGVPYVITERLSGYALTGTMLYKTSSGYQGKSGLQGLQLVPSFTLNNAPVWYYDGTYLRYGSTNGKYLIYNTSNQVALGTLSQGKPFDKVTLYSSSDKTFTLHPSGKSSGTTNYYLNQYGGVSYNVAGVYSVASTSRWKFSQLLPERTVSLTVASSGIELNAGSTLNVDAQVLVNGVATSDYVLSWSVSDETVAAVDASGVVTGLTGGEAVLTVRLLSANGRLLDRVLTVKVPIRVADIRSVSCEQEGSLKKVSSLSKGVPYVITERLSGHALTGSMIYKTSSGYKGLSGTQGLKIEATVDLSNAPVWYYDGTYLRYGSADGKYLIYNNSNQVALGKLTDGKPFDRVSVYSSSDQTFNLWPSGKSSGSTNYYLNQLGGSNYNAAGLYSSAYHSRWQFSKLIPARTIMLSSAASLTLTAGSSAKPNVTVVVDGMETADVRFNWTSTDETVASVDSDGTVFATGAGQTVIMLKLVSADGRNLDQPLVLEIPVQVTMGAGYTASALQEGRLTLTNTLKEGVPYLITEKVSGYALTGDMIYKTDADYKGLSGTQGLKVVPTVDLRNAPVWYCDGTYLRYGSMDGEYLIYNNSDQVALGTLSEGKPFDKVTVYSKSDKTFNLWVSGKSSGSTNYYLNQLGGTSYNAAGLYTSAYYSRWQFSEVVPERLVSVTVTPALDRLNVGKSVQTETSVNVNGVEVSDYVLTWKTSNTAVATVVNGKITPNGAGDVVITVTVTSAQGSVLETPVIVEIPMSVR